MVVQSPFPSFTLPQISFYEFLFRNATKHAHRPAVIDAVTGEEHTYGKLLEEIGRLSSGLSRYGVGKGSVVVVFSPNRVEYIATCCALHLLGAIFAPANCMYTEGELLSQLKDSGADFVFCGDGLEELSLRACHRYRNAKAIFTYGSHSDCLSYKSLLRSHSTGCTAKHDVAPEDVVAYFYSSGTTGLPKGIVLTNRNTTAEMFQYGAKFAPSLNAEHVLVFTPLSHELAYLLFSHAFSNSHTVILFQNFDLELYLKTISVYKPRFVLMVPPVAVIFTKHPSVSKYDLSSIVEIFFCGAPLRVELEDELRKRLPGVRIVQGYGMTESVGATHVIPPGEQRKGSVGPPCPNTEAKIVDPETGRELGPWETGEICMRGPQVMKGYLNKPQATASTLDKDGWLHSGDIGFYDHDGYFYVVDRVKELINYKDFKVAPAELEDIIVNMPEVDDVGVTWIPDTLAGELPTAFVVRKSGQNITAKQVQDYVADRVAPYKQLRGGVCFVNEIPKSPSGKILRRVLREKATQSKL